MLIVGNALACIQRFSSIMLDTEREHLIKKYIPLALESLMPKIVEVTPDELLYSKRMQEEEQAIIKEVDEDDYESD